MQSFKLQGRFQARCGPARQAENQTTADQTTELALNADQKPSQQTSLTKPSISPRKIQLRWHLAYLPKGLG